MVGVVHRAVAKWEILKGRNPVGILRKLCLMIYLCFLFDFHTYLIIINGLQARQSNSGQWPVGFL